MFLKKIKQKLWLKRCECLINNLFIICLHTLNWLVMTKKEIGNSVLLNIWVISTQLNIYIFANITGANKTAVVSFKCKSHPLKHNIIGEYELWEII